jgi:hypothetical protein
MSENSSLAVESEEIEAPYDEKRLLIDGLSESCTDEMIQLYVILILNANLDDAFKIEELRRNRKRVLLKFNKQYDFESIEDRQRKLPELCGNLLTFHKVKVPNTIRASELSNNCTKEVLNLYFSNTKVSLGGDIKSIKVFSYENKALVEFKNYKKVDDVMSRAHVICENLIKLEKYYGPIEDEHFIEQQELENDGFYDVKRDLDSGKLDKSAKKKTMSSMASLKSFSLDVTKNIDKSKLVIANIQENVNIQQLEFAIQLITHRSDIHEINWSMDQKGKLLIDFKKDVDIEKMIYDFEQSPWLKNLNGKQISIEPVNITKTIVVLVKDIKLKRAINKLDSAHEEEDYKPEAIPATRDLLDLYFSNKQRSGGGVVESIERKSARYWLVRMRDYRCIRDILSRKHIIDEKPIKVFPYFDNFGLPYVFRPIFDEFYSSANSAVVFRLKIKDERLRYFCKVKSLHKKLNEILSESNAISRYNKQESNILYVNYEEVLKTKVPYMEKIWRFRVKESIEYFLQIYKYEKLTLSFNQWQTLCKTKQINETLLNKNGNEGFDDEDTMVDAGAVLSDSKIKFVGNNCAIISINETGSNVEINVVGPNVEVDRFIVKIKDIICKAYFTFELEEKIIKFKTYLYECEDLLNKWLKEASDGTAESDAEVTLGSNKSDTDSVSITFSKGIKLNKNRRKTIDEFISKLERDHLDMELSYGKLFQELGYTFLSTVNEETTEEDDDEYRELNDRVTSALEDMTTNKAESESQMDKIKFTLDDLRMRINDMRKKFRTFISNNTSRPAAKQAHRSLTSTKKRGQTIELSDDDIEEEDEEDQEEDEDDDDDDENEDLINVCVYVKSQAKIMTLKVLRKCKVKELKTILLEKLGDAKTDSINDIVLTFNNVQLANNAYTLEDYDINDKCTITLEFNS